MLIIELDVMEYAVTMEEPAEELIDLQEVADEKELFEVDPDLDEFYYDHDEWYDECGFNPYMGCYDFDC